MLFRSYWFLFGEKSDDEYLVNWSDKYKTNNEDIDNHHIALMTHINRFYMTAISKNDIDTAVKIGRASCRERV